MIEIASLIFGGLLRLAPEVLKWLNLKTEQIHEFRMQELQLKRDQLLHEQAIEKLNVEAQTVLDRGELEALTESIRQQGRPTSIRWVDALNATVRPFVTYYFLSIYAAVKTCMIYLIIQGGEALADAFVQAWTSYDSSTLAGILGFWFIERSIRHRNFIK